MAIATRLLWRHPVGGVSTWSHDLPQIEYSSLYLSSSSYSAPTALGIKVQSRFAETRFAETLTLTLTINPNFGESGFGESWRYQALSIMKEVDKLGITFLLNVFKRFFHVFYVFNVFIFNRPYTNSRAYATVLRVSSSSSSVRNALWLNGAS